MDYEKAVEITENIVGCKENIYWETEDVSPVIQGFLFGSEEEVKDKKQIVTFMLNMIGVGKEKVAIDIEHFNDDFYRIAIYMDLNIITVDEFTFIAQLVKLYGKTYDSVKDCFY